MAEAQTVMARNSILGSSKQVATTFPFMQLPRELRAEVYRYLLSTEYTKQPSTYHKHTHDISVSFARPSEMFCTKAFSVAPLSF